MSNAPGSPGEWFDFFLKKAKEMGLNVDPDMFKPDTPTKQAGETWPQSAIDENVTLKAKNADLRRNLDHNLELLKAKGDELNAVRGENDSLRQLVESHGREREVSKELLQTRATVIDELREVLRLRDEQLRDRGTSRYGSSEATGLRSSRPVDEVGFDASPLTGFPETP